MADYQKLDVWALAYELTLDVYSATRSFPADERFGLRSQLRRAAASIPANIAEGAGRGSDRDFARFIGYASASANEVEVGLRLSRDLGYLASDVWSSLHGSTGRVRSMLSRLRATLLAGSG